MLSLLRDFLLAPASARPLAVLRIGLALVLLVQAVFLAPALLELYGPAGFVQWSIIHEVVPPSVPRIDWLVYALAPLGVRSDDCVRGVFLTYVAGLACLLLGWQSRLAAIVSWLGHLMLCSSGSAGIYGVDSFARIALFYCVVTPAGHAWSLDGERPPSTAARLGIRVLQVHLCIAYLAAGLAKVAGEQWWNGDAIWLALNQPTLAQFDIAWLASVPILAKLACWSTLVVELGYPIFIWPRLTRLPWAIATILLHVGIGVGMGLWSFAAVMIVLNLAAFVASPGPRIRP